MTLIENVKKYTAKLKFAILQFKEIETDQGTLFADGELLIGAKVFQWPEGEYAHDGEYVYQEKIYVVKDGEIDEIKEVEAPATAESTEEPIDEGSLTLPTDESIEGDIKDQIEEKVEQVIETVDVMTQSIDALMKQN